MREEKKLHRDNVTDLTAALWRLKTAKQFWGPNGAIRFSRFITRFLNKLDERKALQTRTEVYLTASLYAKDKATAEENIFLSALWWVLGWWDAWRAMRYAERPQDFCGLFAMTPEHLETCVRVYRNMGMRRRALGFVREALDRKDVMHSQIINFLIAGAEILDSLNRQRDAEDFYNQALGIGPEGFLNEIRLFGSYGAYKLRRGDKEAARLALEKALRTARINNTDLWKKDIQALLDQV